MKVEVRVVFKFRQVRSRHAPYRCAGDREAGPKGSLPSTPLELSPLYGESLHMNFRGEWDYNLEWKPIEGFPPTRAGWIQAIHDALLRLHAGKDVGCPALVICSSRSIQTQKWDAGLHSADSVLDVKGSAVTPTRLAQM
jgi:hypothetical protein